jgi:hypothetical protein
MDRVAITDEEKGFRSRECRSRIAWMLKRQFIQDAHAAHNMKGDITMTAHELALEMQAYIADFKKKPKDERVAIATEHLLREGVIDENGEFTDHYAYSREYYRSRKNEKAKTEA